MSSEKDVLGPKIAADVSVLDEYHNVSRPASDGDDKEKTSSVHETLDDDLAEIPELVRNIVSFEDDPTLPVITFRSILLSVLFCVIGSFVSQLS